MKLSGTIGKEEVKCEVKMTLSTKMTVFQPKCTSEGLELGYFTTFKAVHLQQRESYSWHWLDTEWYKASSEEDEEGGREDWTRAVDQELLWGHSGSHHGHGLLLRSYPLRIVTLSTECKS